MQIIVLVILFALSLVLGAAMGLSDFTRSLLNLNLWFVIPIGGILLGGAAGLIHFGGLLWSHVRITMPVMIVLGLSAALGYLAADYSTYYTAEFEEAGEKVVLRDIATFEQYMNVRLSKTTVNSRHGGDKPMYEAGGEVTKLFYLIDLLGAFFGAAGVLYLVREAYPYCTRCSKYLALNYKKKLFFGEEEAFKTSYAEVAKAVEERDGDRARHLLEPTGNLAKKGAFLLEFFSRGCPTCAKGYVLLRPSVFSGKNYTPIKELVVKRDLDSALIRKGVS